MCVSVKQNEENLIIHLHTKFEGSSKSSQLPFAVLSTKLSQKLSQLFYLVFCGIFTNIGFRR